jgi:4-hydroxyphenylpyruvate dioxygenase
MRRSIATVSLSGALDEKLRAIAAAHFSAIELFENDLINFSGKPREVRALAEDLGLSIDLFQPFRDFEGVPDDVFRRNLDRAERKFDTMAELGAPMMLVCSNVSSQAVDDDQRSAAQLHELGERAARRGLRIAYEALAWGEHVRTYRHAWRIVEQAAHPSVGLALDTFHTLAVGDDPAGIADLPGERIAFLQVADAPRLAMDPLAWSRHFRCFPGQGDFDLPTFLAHVLRSGYSGPLSLEIFNDVFRASDPRQTALDAMRSLLLLEAQAREHLSAQPDRTRSVELFDPPSLPELLDVVFLEFAVDADAGRELGQMLVRLGFSLAGRHRSKNVVVYRQGRINLILDMEPDSFAEAYFQAHGPSLCAMCIRTVDEVQTLGRASAFLAHRVEGRVGPNERHIPAIRAIDGSLIYFISGDDDSPEPFASDFILAAPGGAVPEGAGLRRVDHLAMALPAESMDAWVLFYRSILGLEPHAQLELAEPYGLMRSRAVVDSARRLRITLNVAEGPKSAMVRSLTTFAGPGVHHVAFACDDIFETVSRLRSSGVRFLLIPDNYYDDLDARFDLDPGLLDRLRANHILYDRSPAGELFHAPTESFRRRFAIEIVQRTASYDGHGESNAPVFLAAQERAEQLA